MLDKKQEYLLSSLDEIRDDYIAEAANFSANTELEYDAMELVVDGSGETKSTAVVSVEELKRRKKLKKVYGTFGTIAACLVLVVSLGIYQQQNKDYGNAGGAMESAGQVNGSSQEQAIPHDGAVADGGTVIEDGKDPAIDIGNRGDDGVADGEMVGDTPTVTDPGASSLMWYDPEEIFAQNILIVRGTVEDMQVVEGTPLKGEEGHVTYTRVTLRVKNCIKGNLAQDEMIEIRVPFAIKENGNGAEIADLDGYYAGLHLLEIGSEGIFMPHVSANRAYYFGEGRRYLFVETEDGVFYADEVYEPESNGAVSLDDIEQYIQKIMNQKIIECH